jgi:hypothetical protein
MRHAYSGSCHCQNIELRLESDKTPLELGTRADTCSFCAKHNALYTSDPSGALFVTIRDETAVARYRFGTKTADFVMCTTCGVLAAAIMPDAALAVIHINALDARAEFLANPVQLADFDGESVEQRLARRRAKWTPVISDRTSS